MIRAGLGFKGRLVAVMALSLGLYPACGDDEGSSGGAGGASGGGAGQSSGGRSGSGSHAGSGADAGDAGRGEAGASVAEGGASAGEGGTTFTEGGASMADAGTGGTPTTGGTGGTAAAGGAGAAGGNPEPCAGELANGQCGAAFARVQSAKRTAGSAAMSDVVKLAADSHAGNLLVLGVGVVWGGANSTITVPPAFTLIHRRDNAVGGAHESAALYLAEGAASLPAATGVSASVSDPDARLYLVLAEYAGFRTTGVVDQVASQAASGPASTSTTSQTTADDELWVMLALSRGGGGHSAPSNGFAILQTMATGAGSFSLSDLLVSARGTASSGLTSSGDYAAIVATLRR